MSPVATGEILRFLGSGDSALDLSSPLDGE